MRSSDHFTMSIPVEHRFPLLDYRLVEFGLRLPISYMFRNGWTKYIMRKAMQPYLPAKVLWRRKKWGFSSLTAAIFKQCRGLWTFAGGTIPAFFRPCRKTGGYSELLERDPALLWR